MRTPKKEALRIFRIVVAGIVMKEKSKEKSVLLLKRSENEEVYPGMWEFPSGKREFGETNMEAVIREVKEETELSITVVRPLSVFEYIIKTPTEIRDTTQINFLVHLSNSRQEPKLGKEHQKLRWFTVDEIRSLQPISEKTRNSAITALGDHP